jgi:hypothetical protein
MSCFLISTGIVIGLIVAAPIGPVNLICIRRTLAYGPINGFFSGLGAALGDGIFAMSRHSADRHLTVDRGVLHAFAFCWAGLCCWVSDFTSFAPMFRCYAMRGGAAARKRK